MNNGVPAVSAQAPTRSIMREPPKVVIGAPRPPVAAVTVGLALRSVWVMLAAHAPAEYSSDGATYTRMAMDLARGRGLTIGGSPTAMFPPGYPAFLAIPLRLGSTLFGAEPWKTAILLNIVLGGVTIYLAWRLTSTLASARAASTAAWLMALAPSAIFMSAHVMSETLFVTAMFCFLLLTHTLNAARFKRPVVAYVLFGALVGALTLIRTPGIVLLVAPLLLRPCRSTTNPASTVRRWHVAVALVIGAALMLVPWTIRNGLRVGVWTPTSTNNAGFLCAGNRDGADGRWVETPSFVEYCLRHSPWDNRQIIDPRSLPPGVEFTYPNEPDWYRTTMSRTVSWMVKNPGAQPRLVSQRARLLLTNDNDPQYVGYAADGSLLGGTTTANALAMIGNVWYYAVIAFSVCALGAVRSARRAQTIWVTSLLLTATALTGVAYPQFRLPPTLLMVVIAAMVVDARIRRPSFVQHLLHTSSPLAGRQLVSRLGGRIESGRAIRARLPIPIWLMKCAAATRRTAPMVSRTVSHIAQSLALGAFVGASAFDLASMFTATPCTDFRVPAAWLVNTGLFAGATRVVLAPSRIGPGELTDGSKSITRMGSGLWSLALALYTASFAVRENGDTCGTLPLPALVLSAAGLAVILLARWYDLRNTHSRPAEHFATEIQR